MDKIIVVQANYFGKVQRKVYAGIHYHTVAHWYIEIGIIATVNFAGTVCID